MESHKYIHPHFLLACVNLFLLTYAAPSPALAQYHKQGPTERLMQLLKENQSLRFQLVLEKDPYQHYTQRRGLDGKASSLNLHYDHTFEESVPGKEQAGHWELNPQTASLTIQYESEARQTRGITSSTPSHFQEFEIKSFSNYRLVLAWQGRHGMVERTYVLDRRTHR